MERERPRTGGHDANYVSPVHVRITDTVLMNDWRSAVWHGTTKQQEKHTPFLCQPKVVDPEYSP
jgi:hypothetical protein